LIIFFSKLGTALLLAQFYMHSQNFDSRKIGCFQSEVTSHLIKQSWKKLVSYVYKLLINVIQLHLYSKI